MSSHSETTKPLPAKSTLTEIENLERLLVVVGDRAPWGVKHVLEASWAPAVDYLVAAANAVPNLIANHPLQR